MPRPTLGERLEMKWQPIETAPKDGTKILVFTIHGDVELSDWYFYDSERYEPVEGTDGLFRRVTEKRGLWNSNTPTHWAPLPAPPADAEEAAEKIRATWENDLL